MLENLKILKPVDMTKNIITSRFWDFRWQWMAFHQAYDFAPTGSYRFKPQAIIAGIDAKIVQIFTEPKGFGLYIKLQPLEFPLLLCFKAHLRQVIVKEGENVKAGQEIAIMGNSGNCYSLNGGDGTHLHEEWRLNMGRGMYKKLDVAKYYKNHEFRLG